MSELIRREDAIKGLEYKRVIMAEADGFGGGYVYEDGQCDAFTESIEFLKRMPTASPWHRVEEPPKEYGNYLAVVNGEVMEVTYSDISMRDDWNWSTCDAEGFVWIRSESVTHWMPLPEPPKEGKDA